MTKILILLGVIAVVLMLSSYQPELTYEEFCDEYDVRCNLNMSNNNEVVRSFIIIRDEYNGSVPDLLVMSSSTLLEELTSICNSIHNQSTQVVFIKYSNKLTIQYPLEELCNVVVPVKQSDSDCVEFKERFGVNIECDVTREIYKSGMDEGWVLCENYHNIERDDMVGFTAEAIQT